MWCGGEWLSWGEGGVGGREGRGVGEVGGRGESMAKGVMGVEVARVVGEGGRSADGE